MRFGTFEFVILKKVLEKLWEKAWLILNSTIKGKRGKKLCNLQKL